MLRHLAAPVLIVAMFSFAAIGCGDDTTGSDSETDALNGLEEGDDAYAGDASPIADTESGNANQWTAPEEGDDWRALFTYAGRIPGATGNSDEIEIWLMSPTGTDKQRITELAALEQFEDPPLSCAYGCFLSDDLKWMAIATGPPTNRGFTFRVGQFDQNMNFKLIKDLLLEDKVDFKFAGDRLYYSELRSGFDGCVTCQYDLYYIDLNFPKPEQILVFPTDDILEQSTFRGHFKVSKDGNRLVLLNTTIRSVGIYLWTSGVGLTKLDYICKFGTEGNCQGTGSEYSDVDPVAISNDGSKVAFFTFSDRFQRARIYDATDPNTPPSLAVLGSVPSGSYIEHICDPGALSDWQWQRVVGNPVFTPDDKEIVFLAETACRDENNQLPAKAQRNIKRIKVETLESGITIEEEDVFDVSKSPPGNVTANLYITAFDLSADGATVLFTGTPQSDQSGAILQDSSQRQENDREVWRMRLDGTNRQQLTNDVSYEARSPRAIAP